MESFLKILGIILWELSYYITPPTEKYKNIKREKKRKWIQRKIEIRDAKRRIFTKDRLNKLVKFILFYLILVLILACIEYLFNRELTFLKSLFVPFIVSFFVFTFGAFRNEDKRN